jgi:hypothetical protein
MPLTLNVNIGNLLPCFGIGKIDGYFKQGDRFQMDSLREHI